MATAPTPQEKPSGLLKELNAGVIDCPNCHKPVEMLAEVLGRRQSGSPIIDQKRYGVCLRCDIEIEDKLEKAEICSNISGREK